MKIFLVSDNRDTLTGLRLVGIDGAIVHEEEEFKNILNQISEKDIGILLIVEKLAKKFHEQVNAMKLSGRLPLIVEIPDRYGSGRQKDFITAYIREAIGIRL